MNTHVCPSPDSAKVHRVTGNPRYCELTNPAHAAYSPAYLAVVESMAAMWPGDQGPLWNPPHTDNPSPYPLLIPVADALRARIEACPHRTPVGECRCSGLCAMGRGTPTEAGSLVEPGDCERCPDLPA